jgi:hypothetical protein
MFEIFKVRWSLLFIRVFVAVCLCEMPRTFGADQVGDDKLALQSVLALRGSEIRTVEADVEVRLLAGKERDRHRQLWKSYREWLVNIGDVKRVEKLDKSGVLNPREWEQDFEPEKMHVLYDSKLGVRVSIPIKNQEAFKDDVYLGVNGKWFNIQEPTNNSRPVQVTISKEIGSEPARHVTSALGLGMPLFPGVLGNREADNAVFSNIIPWSSLLAVFDKVESITRRGDGELINNLSGFTAFTRARSYGKDYPNLTAPDGFAEVLWDFEKRVPRKLVYKTVIPYSDGHVDYVPTGSVEWTDFVSGNGGNFVCVHAVIGIFSQSMNVENYHGGLENVPFVASETWRTDISFRNVRINKGIDETQLSAKLSPGSHVLDSVKGEAYVVGSAGEALRKVAVASRQRGLLSPPKPQRTILQKTAMAVNLIVFVTAIFVWIGRWRRRDVR